MKAKQLFQREPWEPEAIIIYVQPAEIHMVGAGRKNGKWLYSKPLIRPISELNSFTAGCLEDGMFVLDLRKSAKIKQPGMERATPIVIANTGVDIRDAVQAMAILHTAILNTPD